MELFALAQGDSEETHSHNALQTQLGVNAKAFIPTALQRLRPTKTKRGSKSVLSDNCCLLSFFYATHDKKH
jgi:hypothetical protein